MTKTRPTQIDELKNAFNTIQNDRRDVTRSEAPNTRSAFQNKLEQFVQETKTELSKNANEMNSTFQDFRSKKMHGQFKPQTPIFSQRPSEMGRTFQSGHSNQRIKLLPMLPDQSFRIQSPSSYHKNAHTPSTFSTVSQRQTYFNAKRKTEFTQGSARSHIGLDDRVTLLLQAGHQKIS